MCLEKISEEKTANKNITVWKRLMMKNNYTIENIESYHGKPFTANVHGEPVVGIISVYGGKPYLCNATTCGSPCSIKFGYDYSWVVDDSVTKLVIDGEAVMPTGRDLYLTPYKKAVVKLGNFYNSELIVEGNTINVGIHSFVTKADAIDDGSKGDFVVKCFIPKGAKYYTGRFNEYKSIASDQLQYTEQIEEI